MKESSVVQRLLPGIGSGAISTRTGGSIHVRQGQLDGACGIYCAAMSLTLLGRIRRPTVLTGKRRTNAVAALWDASLPQFFEGTSAEELAGIISAFGRDLNVTWDTGAQRHASEGHLRGHY